MTKEKSEMGRKSRGKGMRFELKVRHKLESDGWTVCKWTNIIKDGKIVAAPRKYNPFTKQASSGNGFPDFVCFREKISRILKDGIVEKVIREGKIVIGVESKSNKYLDAAEKVLCEEYKKLGTFDEIEVAYKNKKGKIDYYKV